MGIRAQWSKPWTITTKDSDFSTELQNILDGREKQERRKELTEQLAASRKTESSVDIWLDMMQDYAQLEELDRPTLVRLIQKIEISERYTVDGHEAGVLRRCCEFQNLFQVLQEQGPHSESGGKLGYVQECPRNQGNR